MDLVEESVYHVVFDLELGELVLVHLAISVEALATHEGRYSLLEHVGDAFVAELFALAEAVAKVLVRRGITSV